MSPHLGERSVPADPRDSRSLQEFSPNLFYEVLSLQGFQSGCLARKGSPGTAWALVPCGTMTISPASPWPGNPSAQQAVESGIVPELSVLCLALLPPAGLGIAANFILF